MERTPGPGFLSHNTGKCSPGEYDTTSTCSELILYKDSLRGDFGAVCLSAKQAAILGKEGCEKHFFG